MVVFVDGKRANIDTVIGPGSLVKTGSGSHVIFDSVTLLRRDRYRCEGIESQLCVDFLASAIEPGVFDWTHSDLVIDHAERQGLQVIARLGFVPPWARNRTA